MTEKDNLNDDNYLLRAVFCEYQKRVQAHFEATDARIGSEVKLLVRENELMAKALALQAVIYEDRLVKLNHAHELAIQEQGRVLPREMHEAFVKENNTWRNSINVIVNQNPSIMERIASQGNRLEMFIKEYDSFKLQTVTALSVMSTRSITWTTALGVLFMALNILIVWYKK